MAFYYYLKIFCTFEVLTIQRALDFTIVVFCLFLFNTNVIEIETFLLIFYKKMTNNDKQPLLLTTNNNPEEVCKLRILSNLDHYKKNL